MCKNLDVRERRRLSTTTTTTTTMMITTTKTTTSPTARPTVEVLSRTHLYTMATLHRINDYGIHNSNTVIICLSELRQTRSSFYFKWLS